MARAVLGAAVYGDGHGSHAIGSSALQLSGTLLMLCVAAAILSAVVIRLFGKGKKKKRTCADPKPGKPSNAIIFTGYSCSPSDGSCSNMWKENGGAGGGGASGGGGQGSGCVGGS